MKNKGFIEGILKKTGYFLTATLLFCLLLHSNCFASQNNNVTSGLNPEINSAQTISSIVDEEKKFQELRQESQKNTSLFSPAKVFSNLITLIFILMVIAWLYNKYGKDTMEKVLAVKKINRNNINILSSSAIGQGKYLHIVEVDGEKILIGATANNISFLKELKNTKEEKVVFDE